MQIRSDHARLNALSGIRFLEPFVFMPLFMAL
jgi:hypothetical protein